ncbi:MAG: RDD family protein [Pyrinomonadaceae bacterium]
MAICATCGTNNVDGTKFCVQCGAALAPTPGGWRTPTEELNAPAGSGAPAGSPYAPPPPPNPAFQTPPPPLAPYGYSTPIPTAYGAPMRYAEWGDRVVAALIDGGINLAIMIVLFIVFIVLAGLGSAAGGQDSVFFILCFGMIITFVSVFGFGLYNKVFLVSKRGSSIGQNTQNLKVVEAAGNIPSIGTLILRLLVQTGLGIIPMVGWLLVVLDLLFPLWDEKKQTIHDKAASTFVIKTA